MSTEISTVFFYMLIPMAAVVGGGALSAVWEPASSTRSGIQHFAAGVVLAAVAIELLPEVTEGGHTFSVVVGFVIGVALMVTVKQAGNRMESAQFAGAGMLALWLTVGIDIFVDGILVGVSFLAGTEKGVLITIALTLEAFFLALAAATTLRNRGQSRVHVFLAAIALAVLLGCGALLGAGLFADASTGLLHGVIAFAVSALLYLVVEELLVEAHEVEETPTTTVLFFAGFLSVMMMETVYDRLFVG